MPLGIPAYIHASVGATSNIGGSFLLALVCFLVVPTNSLEVATLEPWCARSRVSKLSDLGYDLTAFHHNPELSCNKKVAVFAKGTDDDKTKFLKV